MFLMAILAVTDERNEHPALAPLAIGLTLAMIHFATIPLTGTSVNPARSIGPALFAGVDAIAQLWLFILATLLGGALAGLLYPLVFGRHGEPVAGSGLRFGRRPPPGAVPGYGAPDAYQQQWNQQYGVPQPGQPGQPGQAPWPPQPPQQWQQPQYPTAPPPPQSWPQQPPPQAPPAVARGRRRRPDPSTAARLNCLAPLGCPARRQHRVFHSSAQSQHAVSLTRPGQAPSLRRSKTRWPRRTWDRVRES